MADKIKANTERMRQDVENISTFVRQIEKYYQNLIQMKGELDGMWDGLASDSFKKVFDDDLIALQTMIGNLKKIYNYENMAKECYSACEEQVSGVISEI